MSSFVLKIIAIVTMFCDHIGYVIFGKISFFNYIGRIAFPIFAFQVAEGYRKTKNLKNYVFRLFVFAIISQIPYMVFINSIIKTNFKLNVFFTLLFGLLCIIVWDKCHYKILSLLFVFFSCILSQLLHFDYGAFGIILILTFHILYDKKIPLFIIYTLLVIAKYIISTYYYMFILFSIIPLICIFLYNGKKGRSLKYFFYFFYPVHLLILGIINNYIK